MAIYLMIVILFIGGLGLVLTFSYRHNLIHVRENEVLVCAGEIAEMYADGSLTIFDIENGQNEPVLRTTAKDFHATILLANADSKRIFYKTTEDEFQVVSANELIDEEIYRCVCVDGKSYIRSNYYFDEMDAQVSTIAYPIRGLNAHVNDKPWAILIIHSDLKAINVSLREIILTLWLPAVAIALLGLIVLLLMIRGIIKRVQVLNGATKQIAKGHFDQRVSFRQKDEISQLADGFNAMAEELAISDASKRDFVSNAAHELRSPMTSINGFVEGMLDGTIPPEEHEKYLTVVSTEVKRLTKLVKSMLDLSRIESGRDKLNIQKVDINEMIRRVVIRFSQKIEDKGVIPDIGITDGKLMVSADPDKIEEVLQNLVDNAIKFTPADKGLYIGAERVGQKVVVTVRDEGAGISEEDLKFIWDRFYTVDKAHTGHKSGTGLGLPIVKSIIEQHKEEIHIQSRVNEGTEFTFTLALAE